MSDTQPVQVVLDLANLPLAYGENGVMFTDHVVNRTAKLMLEKAAGDDWHGQLASRVRDIRDEEIRAAVRPLIEQALAEPIQPVYGSTKVPLAQHIVDTAKKALQWRRGEHRNDDSMLAQLVREQVERTLTRELQADIDSTKNEVRAAIREKAAEVLSQTIEKMAVSR